MDKSQEGNRRNNQGKTWGKREPNAFNMPQSLTTVLLRTPITQMIFFNQGMLLLGSNHFLNKLSVNLDEQFHSGNPKLNM